MIRRLTHAPILLFFLSISLLPVSSSAQSLIDYYVASILGENALVCNGPMMDFNNGFGEWTVTTNEPSGPQWGRLGDCGEGANYTGGVGDVACVSSDLFGVAEHDTSLVSPEFNLNGISTAELHFDLAYWPWNSGTSAERLDLEISYDGGGSWITIETWNTLVGVFRSSGAPQTINLSPFVGSEESKLRFRYYDSGVNDWNGYAQIDNVSLDCTGGADLELSLTTTPTSPVEGVPVEFFYTITNNGPNAAANVLALAGPFDGADEFELLSIETEPEGLSTSTIFTGVPLLNPGESFSVRATGVFHLANNPTLSVLSPSTLAGDYEISIPAFAPPIPSGSSYSGTLVAPNDGAGNVQDGCTPFVNASEISGNIVLIDKGSCSYETKAENAEAAGAQAVIIRDEVGIIVLSQAISRVVTIPVVVVSEVVGGTILAEISSGVEVSLTTGFSSSKEFEVLAITRGDSADPLLDNNYEVQTITVLADRDGDGVADQDDGCMEDPGKSAPLFCGCGNLDVDADGSGVVDCLLTDELSVKLQTLRDAVQALRPLKLTGNKKKDKKRKKKNRERRKLVQETLAAFEGAVSLGISSYDVTAETDLSTSSAKVSRKTKKTRRTKSKKFRKLKRKALKSIEKLLSGLVTQSI